VVSSPRATGRGKLSGYELLWKTCINIFNHPRDYYRGIQWEQELIAGYMIQGVSHDFFNLCKSPLRQDINSPFPS